MPTRPFLDDEDRSVLSAWLHTCALLLLWIS